MGRGEGGIDLKRSKNIRLLLLGGLSAGALSSCAPSGPGPVSTEAVYTNDYFVQGVGYYHAPFHNWYALPYNYHDAANHRYYYAGSWAEAPYASIVNLSSPTADAVRNAEAIRTDVVRGGFGGTGSGHTFFG